jgi:hypothetical protein
VSKIKETARTRTGLSLPSISIWTNNQRKGKQDRTKQGRSYFYDAVQSLFVRLLGLFACELLRSARSFRNDPVRGLQFAREIRPDEASDVGIIRAAGSRADRRTIAMGLVVVRKCEIGRCCGSSDTWK